MSVLILYMSVFTKDPHLGFHVWDSDLEFTPRIHTWDSTSCAPFSRSLCSWAPGGPSDADGGAKPPHAPPPPGG